MNSNTDVELIKKALYEKGPLSMGMYVGGTFGSITDGIYEPQAGDCDNYLQFGVNHAMLFVGYGSEFDEARQETIDYLSDTTPAGSGEIVKAVERYIVMPGQATAYKLGMLKILELRKMAKQELSDRFDLKMFHDQILRNGPLPLDILEREFSAWLEQRKTSKM